MTFADREEAAEFFKNEAEVRGSWLRQGVRQFTDQARLFLTDIPKIATDARMQIQQENSSLLSAQRYLDIRPAIHARARLQPFIAEVSGRSPSEAAVALARVFHLSRTIPSFDPGGTPVQDVIGGYILANTWKMGLIPEAGVEIRIAKVEQGMDRIAELSQRAVKAVADSTQHAESTAAVAKQTLSRADSLLDQCKADFAIFSDKSRVEWDTLRETFEKALGLRAPAEYWSIKETLINSG